MNTEINTKPKTEEYLQHYREACDPLLMMGLLMEFGRIQRHELTDKDFKEISACHNLLATIFRNE